ncbi:site-specific integrase [Blastococcus sp. VKM Ac-2987]|uniref:site-specific integrase n=1 Tax=Blastococcus sp. VKM Ac-2987 TaxID=3004141 RepID=UPI0022AB9018|nr:site-specific integrase [Blastococcus sp. VKM Ac-2987]MCZ2857446.1 tyrosine-type recombinase/integrase [Blastococcus sp. VKM Ac-2987]
MGKRIYGTVRRLASGRYQARWFGPEGKQHPAPRTFATKTDANRWLAHHQAAVDKGEWIDTRESKVMLKGYAEQWITTRRVKGKPLAPRTAELYRSLLNKHIAPVLGTYEMRGLTASAVRSWYAELSKKIGEGSTVPAKSYRFLRAVCQTAVEDEMIGRNPCAIRGAGQERTSERPMFTLAQVQALADEVDERWRALILMAAWTSLRLGELAALRRDDVDLKAGTVTVMKAKSEAGKRTVAVPPHVMPELCRHVESYSEPGPRGLVFVGPKGAPIRRNNFANRVWVPARDAVGLPEHSHLHDLRGVGATWAARAGATTKELQARLGHASPAMALRYQRAEQDRDATLAAAMSEAIRQPVGTAS